VIFQDFLKTGNPDFIYYILKAACAKLTKERNECIICRSEYGERAAVLYSILQTCCINGVAPLIDTMENSRFDKHETTSFPTRGHWQSFPRLCLHHSAKVPVYPSGHLLKLKPAFPGISPNCLARVSRSRAQPRVDYALNWFS
jgi:hypothetical protein